MKSLEKIRATAARQNASGFTRYVFTQVARNLDSVGGPGRPEFLQDLRAGADRLRQMIIAEAEESRAGYAAARELTIGDDSDIVAVRVMQLLEQVFADELEMMDA